MSAATWLLCCVACSYPPPEVGTEPEVEEQGDAGLDGGGDAGLLSCPEGKSDCNGQRADGCEVDLLDPQHCGRCGHSCLGGACEAGGCQPVTLASGQDKPCGIALATHDELFWTNAGGTVMRAGRDGSGQAVIAANQGSPVAVTVDSHRVYWTDFGMAGSVSFASRDGGAPVAIASGQKKARSIAVGATGVFWVNFDSGELMRSSLNGTATTPLMTHLAGPMGVALTERAIYVSSGGMRAVLEIALDGSDAGVIADHALLQRPDSLAASRGELFWTDTGGMAQDPGIWKAPLDGGPVVRIAQEAAVPRYLAVDDQHVYWTNLGGPGVAALDGKIMSVPRSGGPFRARTSVQYQPCGIAVDDQAIYWTNTGSGTVMRLAK